jgi:hypothetical protein
MQKSAFCFLFIVIGILLSFCQRSKPTVMGLPCYNLDSRSKVTTLTQQHLTNYQHLKDTIFKLPHAPIHRCLKGSDHLTYVGLYTDDSLASVKDSLSENPYLIKQRTDTLGFHCMLNNEGEKAYLFLTNGEAGPLLFLNRGTSDSVAKKAFMNKHYYARRLQCD